MPERFSGTPWPFSDRLALMRFFLAMLPGIFLLCSATAAPRPGVSVVPGDSRRGAKVFENQQCIRCHAVNGRGGKMGLDLARSVSRSYTPARLASTMWNHAPTMWGAINAGGIKMPRLAPKDAADLFAYFYSTASSKLQATPSAAKPPQFRQVRPLPRHHRLARRGRDPGRQMGIARRSHPAGSADVES